MIRAFIAIKIVPSEEFILSYQVLKKQLANENINWVDYNNLHLTLKFLGNISTEDVQTLKKELKKVNTGPPFHFQIEGVHLFKDIHTPRVIYSEIKTGNELYNLAEEVNNCLLKLHIYPEGKKFLPHLTLGRIKFLNKKENLELVLHDFRKVYFQKVECTEFILFESKLNPTGPVYNPLAVFKLH
jgi:RNA 2',3'-cyclic 3'-phosphodiesterase